MLQDLRSGNASLFCNMANNKHRKPFFLCQPHDPHGTLPNLTDAAWCRGNIISGDGLDRVNNNDFGLLCVDAIHDRIKIGLC